MTIKERLVLCIKKAFPAAIKTATWIIKLTIPISLGVMLLSYFGILPYISSFAAPFFTHLGLSGDAALVFVTSIFTNIYTVIALVTSMGFDVRAGLIIATMCLISHNFVVENLVQKRTGSSFWRMTVLRLMGSFVGAWLLNIFLPTFEGNITASTIASSEFSDVLYNWGISSLILCVKMICIIFTLMVIQRILEEFGILKYLSMLFMPLLKIFGLPHSTSFMWIVGNSVGLAYGGAIMMDAVDSGKLDKNDADLLNHHLALSHSQLEDPILFIMIGLPALYVMIPRVILAIAAVWLRRAELALVDLYHQRAEISIKH